MTDRPDFLLWRRRGRRTVGQSDRNRIRHPEGAKRPRDLLGLTSCPCIPGLSRRGGAQPHPLAPSPRGGEGGRYDRAEVGSARERSRALLLRIVDRSPHHTACDEPVAAAEVASTTQQAGPVVASPRLWHPTLTDPDESPPETGTGTSLETLVPSSSSPPDKFRSWHRGQSLLAFLVLLPLLGSKPRADLCSQAWTNGGLRQSRPGDLSTNRTRARGAPLSV